MADQAQAPLVAKVKIAGKTGTITFGEETCVIKIDGREFTFMNKERVSDVQSYIENELC